MTSPQTRRVLARVLAAASVAAMLVLHNDCWNRSTQTSAVFGWVPADIAYHVAWVAAGCLVLLLVLRTTWPRAR